MIHALLSAHRFAAPPRILMHVGYLRAAKWDKVVVTFGDTVAKRAETRRRVFPLGLIYPDFSNVPKAWFHLRRDDRKFRLDGMRKLARTEESFRTRRVAMPCTHTDLIRDHITSSAEPRAPHPLAL